MAPKLFDTHSHLSLLEHDDQASILKRARESGVWRQVTVSTDPTNWGPNQELAENHDDLYFSIGVHPHEAKHWPKWKDDFYACFPKDQAHERCVAVGEMGLDYHYNHSTRDEQLAVFEEQLLFAKKINLPLIIHCRDAFDDVFSLFEKHGLPERKAVFHCFTGGPNEALKGVEWGVKISFSGIVTFKNANPIREAAKAIPKESILIETDCPFLAPVPKRGKPNEPSYLLHTAQFLADHLGLSLEEFAEISTKNAMEFFHTT